VGRNMGISAGTEPVLKFDKTSRTHHGRCLHALPPAERRWNLHFCRRRPVCRLRLDEAGLLADAVRLRHPLLDILIQLRPAVVPRTFTVDMYAIQRTVGSAKIAPAARAGREDVLGGGERAQGGGAGKVPTSVCLLSNAGLPKRSGGWESKLRKAN